MSRTFTKLFSSITASTVWCEPDRTRLVWITMLAMADHAGRVHGSIPGLAHMARVPLEDCEIALRTFLSPDPYSRTPDFEGRRIEPIDGGWRLLNYAKHRALQDAESVKASKRAYINERRAKERQGVEVVDIGRQASTQEEGEAEADTSKAKAKPLVRSAPALDTEAGFEAAWAIYPKRGGGNSRADALKAWRARRATGETVEAMTAGTARYAAYIRATGKERTEYVMQAARFFGPGQHYRNDWAPPALQKSAPSKTMQAIMHLEGIGRGMDEAGSYAGAIEADFSVVGPNAGHGRIAWDGGGMDGGVDDEPGLG